VRFGRLMGKSGSNVTTLTVGQEYSLTPFIRLPVCIINNFKIMSTGFAVYCINNKIRFVYPFTALINKVQTFNSLHTAGYVFDPEPVGSTDYAGTTDIIHLFLYTRS